MDRILRIPLPPETPEGPLDVVVAIAPSQPVLPISSLGRWQAYFPPDLDVEHALREIRHGWEKEWTET